MTATMPAHSQPELEFVACPHPQGEHRMAFWRWGDAQAAHVVVCAHGLTRQGRDFDRLAQALVAQSPHPVQVICPDVVGRGRSDWLAEPTGYQIPQYAADMLAMLAQVQKQIGSEHRIQTLDWVGTSMGGLIGMVLAGQSGLPLPAPIRHLVLNDVGPAIAWSSVQRMQTYVGQYGQYRDLDEAAAALWDLSTGFGPVSADVWREMSAHMLRPGDDGAVTLHYDPAIGVPVRALTTEAAAAGEAALWALYDQIKAKTLLIRGQASDLLTPETATAMTQRGPRAQLDTWPGFGHAPTLTGDDQIEVVAKFLLGD
jgi:pimeloyl-ACP methyl ester carboxylesterase